MTQLPGTLIIPDIHQDFGFLRRILARENVGSVERVVLLGDYFDARDPDFRGPVAATKTATLILEMEAKLGDRLVLLWGNHDVPYHAASVVREDEQPLYAPLGIRPESKSTCAAVHKVWRKSFWKKLRPFVQVGDHLLSHAGVHRSFLPGTARNFAAGLTTLHNQWDAAMGDLLAGRGAGEILSAGEPRGGDYGAIGGPTWLDWDREFVDDLPVAQIVGHTSSAVTRQQGRSHCIDYGQCAYGILGLGGLTVRPIPRV